MSNIKKTNVGMMIDDNINTVEKYEKLLFHNINAGSKSPKIYTEVEFYNELGEHLFTDHNEQVLAGCLFTLSKVSGVNMPINIQTINTDLSVNTNESSVDYTGPRREDVIQGFMIGIDGCTDVFDTVYPVYKKERRLKSLVPFRMPETGADLSTTDAKKYGLKVTSGAYYKYYLKKPETTAVIKAEFDEAGNPSVPANVDTLETTSVINSYLQYTLKISVDDVREYFELEGGGLRKARVNTLGLVTGYPDGNGDFKGCRLFSRINFNNEAFDNETKELTIIYKIYI